MSKEKETQVPVEIYNEAVRKSRQMERELEAFKEKETLVGISWFGSGGFGCGLTKVINGKRRISFNGYGEKAVIDKSTWFNLRGCDLAYKGLLVRDDSVLKELGINGITAEDDKERSPNAITDAEAINLLTGSVKKLKEKMETITEYNAATHLLLEADKQNINDVAKTGIIKERRNYLFEKQRIEKMHDRDLAIACDIHGINPDLDRDVIVERLTEINLQGNEY